MKNYFKLGLALLLLALAFSCKQSDAATEENGAMATDSTNILSSSAVVEKQKSTRKFLRTADIKFKVKQVAKATYAIENSVSQHGGFVTYTNLQSHIVSKDQTKVSQDSTLETTRYTVDNAMVLRVPNTRLDTVLKALAKEVDFLDSRLIKADDVQLQLLANQWTQKRSDKHEARLKKAIDTKGSKLRDISKAEEQLRDKQTQNDEAKRSNLALNDQINFSTVTLYLYQRETVKRELVANERSTNAYRPNIGLQLWDSLKTGWYLLENILAFITQLWPFLLLGALGVLGYQKYFKKK
jgi:hypothetical protein